MQNIIWKPIYLDGFMSDYDISNNGCVRNRESGELRSAQKSNTGYMRLILYRHGKSYPCSIHRLVAQYFVPNSDPIHNTFVDHKDGNKLNNWSWNLEWVTPKENKQRAIKLGLDNPKHGNQPKGSASGVSKHTEEEAHAACKLLEQGLSNKQVADSLGVDTEFVRQLRRGGWKHVTKLYKIPAPEQRSYYPKDIRRSIKTLIDVGIDDITIAMGLGLPDPQNYGRKYVNKIRSRYNQDKSSTTIPMEEIYFKTLQQE